MTDARLRALPLVLLLRSSVRPLRQSSSSSLFSTAFATQVMRFSLATSVSLVLFGVTLVQAQVPSGVPTCHAVCPDVDGSGFAVSGSGSIDANSVATCSYPGFPGDGLSNFWCSYDTVS